MARGGSSSPFRTTPVLRRTLLRTARVRVGEFHCGPGDPRWRRTNVIGAGHHVVFPTTAVRIDRATDRHVHLDGARTVFYRPWEPYDRHLVDPRGDHCVFVALSDDITAEIAEDTGAPRRLDGTVRLTSGPLTTPQYLEARSWVARPDLAEVELVEERVLATVRAAFAGATGVGTARPRRAATRRAHRDLAGAARAVLAADLPERLSLAEVAGRVAASPYHLARVFREQVGSTMLGYRTQLRVQEALERLADPATTAESVAHGLGFSSPAHLTAACRRYAGAPPSGARQLLRREPSTIL